MRDFDRFDKRMQKLGDKFGYNVHKLLRVIGITALNNLIMSTPIDKGRARANWLTEIDHPITDATDDTDWRRAIETGTNTIDQSEIGSRIFLTNNVSYISYLNNGSSLQAPAGFVEKSIQNAKAQINVQTILES